MCIVSFFLYTIQIIEDANSLISVVVTFRYELANLSRQSATVRIEALTKEFISLWTKQAFLF